MAGLVATAALCLALAAAPARRIAVLDFTATWSSQCAKPDRLGQAQREQCEVLQLFADRARAGALAVLRPPAFIVMTRENAAQILKDMGGDCADGECEVETARLLGASVVLSGKVSFLEGTWLVALKVHDVATAALLATGDTRGRTKLEAFDNVRAETERMIREASGVEAAPAAPAPRPAPARAAPPASPAPRAAAPAPRGAAATRQVAPPQPPAPPPEPEEERAPDRFWFSVIANAAGPGSIKSPPRAGYYEENFEAGVAFRAAKLIDRTWGIEATVEQSKYTWDQASSGAAPTAELSTWLIGIGPVWCPGGSRHFSVGAHVGLGSSKASVGSSSTSSAAPPFADLDATAEFLLGPVGIGAIFEVAVVSGSATSSSGIYSVGGAGYSYARVGFFAKLRL